MKMGFAKVTDQEMHVKRKARPLRLRPACGTGCSFGIHVAVDQVLWYICGACHRFMLYGLLCEGKKKNLRKAIDVDYNFNAPQISFVYFIMLMNIITRDF